MKSPRLIDGARIVALAALYVIAGRFGLTLDAVGGFATVVWAPSGLALAAVMIFGNMIAPGVFAGALIANLLTGASLPVAIGIALGNTLEAMVGAWAVRWVPTFHARLDRLVDVMVFLAVCAAAPLVAASIGVASLTAGGMLGSLATGETWRAWWVGDFIGAIMVAPLILVWRDVRLPWQGPARRAEAVAVVLVSLTVSWAVFYEHTPISPHSFIQAYLVFPVLIWAAVRFGQRGAVTSAFLVSLTALGGTVAGTGPFVRADLHDSLYALQTFMGVVAACFLVLGASITDRERAREETRRALDNEAQANRAKAEFIAVLSHELRAPLTAIAGYVDLLKLGVTGPDEFADVINKLKRNQDHLATLVNDVLGFAKLEAAPIAMQRTAVRVAEALDGVEPLVQPELRRKQLWFERQPVDAALAVRADPERLRQVLVNFVMNAAKYTNDGGRVWFSARAEQDCVRISVSDNGVGVPPEMLSRVFEPFFRVDRGDSQAPGVGLGLTIARDLARAMGGEVSIESTVGKGTTVSIVLPAA